MDKNIFSHLVCGIITIVSIVLCLLILAHLDCIWAKTFCGMLIALTSCLGMRVHELIDEEEDHDC
jgi:hypothetical protein